MQANPQDAGWSLRQGRPPALPVSEGLWSFSRFRIFYLPLFLSAVFQVCRAILIWKTEMKWRFGSLVILLNSTLCLSFFTAQTSRTDSSAVVLPFPSPRAGPRPVCSQLPPSTFSLRAAYSLHWPNPVSMPLTSLWHLTFWTHLPPNTVLSPVPKANMLLWLVCLCFFQVLALLPHLAWGSQLASYCRNSRLRSQGLWAGVGGKGGNGCHFKGKLWLNDSMDAGHRRGRGAKQVSQGSSLWHWDNEVRKVGKRCWFQGKFDLSRKQDIQVDNMSKEGKLMEMDRKPFISFAVVASANSWLLNQYFQFPSHPRLCTDHSNCWWDATACLLTTPQTPKAGHALQGSSLENWPWSHEFWGLPFGQVTLLSS